MAGEREEAFKRKESSSHASERCWLSFWAQSFIQPGWAREGKGVEGPAAARTAAYTRKEEAVDEAAEILGEAGQEAGQEAGEKEEEEEEEEKEEEDREQREEDVKGAIERESRELWLARPHT